MASFTMFLWEVLELKKDPGDGSTVGLAQSDYPIFDETYRPDLNKKILNHYWNREIGRETISQFRFAVARRMNEQMALLNEVYLSTRLEFDPLLNIKIETDRDDATTENTTRDSNNSGNSTAVTKSRAINSNFPQTMLAGSEDYADNGADVTNTTTSDNSGTGHDTADTTGSLTGKSTTSGYQGSASDLLMKYRATLLNVDMLVVESLEDCFMQIWDNGDEFLPALEMRYRF